MEKDQEIRELYKNWITAWNHQDASGMKTLLSPDCNMIGFDGSQMSGSEEIFKSLSSIFSQYPTGLFVSIVRKVIWLSEDVALLRADVGMLPRGYDEINPNLNATQSLVAVRQSGAFKMSLFQNTPAAYHMQPDLARQLTEELRTEARNTADQLRAASSRGSNS